VFACASWSVRGEEPAKSPQYEDTDAGRTIAAASTDEAKIPFSAEKADAYLKNGALYWWAEKGCVTCHTNGIYGSERPSLTPVLGKPEADVRGHFVEQIDEFHKLTGDERKALHDGVRPTQVAVITRGLVEWDKHVTGKLSDESKKALSLMFELQAPDGSWGNIECWPPYESSVFQGATVAVMAAATARGWLVEIASEEEKAKFQKALSYLRTTDPGHDYERLLRLWTATRAPSLLSDDEKQAFIEVVWKHQNEDGGWSMLDFYTFENWAAASRPRGFLKRADFDNSPSDGHMTGLALLVLIDSGVDVKDKRIERGVQWLLANQRESGRWWTRSLNTDNYHFITYSATAYALVALHKAGRLRKVAGESENAGNAGPVRFSEHLLVGNLGYVFGVAAADLDGDGDLDLTSPDIRDKSHSTLFWYRNDGTGQFERLVIFKDESGWFERHAIADIDGNGTLDVAIINNQKGNVVWFANSGKPAAGLWRRHVISNDCPRAYDVTLADFDSDGDIDAATTGYVSNQVAWYENPGKDQLDREWTRRVIDGAMQEARTIATGDFNRDGKIDLLAAAVGAPDAPNHESQVVWYENPDEPAKQEWTRRIISKELPAAIHGHPVDLDRDGDLDVVMAHGMRIEADPEVERHQVVWYENTGEPRAIPTWKPHKVGLLPYAFEATAGDIDGDGDLDIAATAWSKGDRVVWFENSGDGRWSQHVVRTDFRAANQVILADLNGDGHVDIVASADDGSRRVQGSLEVRWWRNDGRR
jgi:squalene-hopene/tetraprenyl-beta-curcumene cyclase